MGKHISQCRRWLQHNEEPTMPYVVRLYDGTIGEAISPFYLCDLIFHENYTDCDQPETWFLIMGRKLRRIASSIFAMNQIRVTVYDAKGKFYDNLLSHPENADYLEYENRDSPFILDGFNPWTAIVSLIQAGYIQLWEKYPTFSVADKTSGCANCIFNDESRSDGVPYCHAWDYRNAQYDWELPCWWLTNGESYDDYHFVHPDKITTHLKHRVNYIPPEERTEVYVGFIRASLINYMENNKEE